MSDYGAMRTILSDLFGDQDITWDSSEHKDLHPELEGPVLVAAREACSPEMLMALTRRGESIPREKFIFVFDEWGRLTDIQHEVQTLSEEMKAEISESELEI